MSKRTSIALFLVFSSVIFFKGKEYSISYKGFFEVLYFATSWTTQAAVASPEFFTTAAAGIIGEYTSRGSRVGAIIGGFCQSITGV
jgi:hypothetical protein